MTSMPSVLFVCVHNAGRSQMAAGFLRHFAGDRIEVRSAGSIPAEQINPVAIAAMAELGIDIAGEQPKILTTEAVQASDVVITMGCGDACPFYPGKRYEDWALDDPAGQGIDAVRPIRDDVRARVLQLVSELDQGPFFHGTKADLQDGELLTAGFHSNYRPEIVMNHVYFTALTSGAGLAAELAPGDAAPRVYRVEPTGAFENDPNVTDKKFPGNPTRSYRSASPLRVIAEVTDWPRLTPEALQGWQDRLAELRADERGEIIN